MKKRLSALLTALALILCAIPASAAVQTINTQEVMLYSEPTSESLRLLVIPEGSSLLVLEYADAWARVSYHGGALLATQGWVLRSMLSSIEATPENTGMVVSDALALRESASSLSRQLTTLYNSTLFTVFGEQDDWYRVSYVDPETSTSYNGYVPKAMVVVNPPRLSVRKEGTPALAYPAPDAKQVGRLPVGMILTVIAEYGEYYVVNLRGASAFIHISWFQ